jgi:hypothetical protein
MQLGRPPVRKQSRVSTSPASWQHCNPSLRNVQQENKLFAGLEYMGAVGINANLALHRWSTTCVDCVPLSASSPRSSSGTPHTADGQIRRMTPIRPKGRSPISGSILRAERRARPSSKGGAGKRDRTVLDRLFDSQNLLTRFPDRAALPHLKGSSRGEVAPAQLRLALKLRAETRRMRTHSQLCASRTNPRLLSVLPQFWLVLSTKRVQWLRSD